MFLGFTKEVLKDEIVLALLPTDEQHLIKEERIFDVGGKLTSYPGLAEWLKIQDLLGRMLVSSNVFQTKASGLKVWKDFSCFFFTFQAKREFA